MPELVVELDLRPEQVLAYYRGEARVVRARTTSGQIVQFPANVLHRYVTREGVRGRYRLQFDSNHKFICLEPL